MCVVVGRKMTNEVKKNKIWVEKFPKNDESADIAVAELTKGGYSEVFAKLLYNRGLTTKEAAERFLKSEDAVFHDPYLLNDIDIAVERIKKAVENKERIAIYGDYDVDGVTSVSMLYLYLSSLGGDVGYYIPSRDNEGYGLSKLSIDNLAKRGVQLIVTVDTGITANEEALYAKSLGMDMVVTDHHECRPELPECCAVVNPHRNDSTYPFCELAGVGVVFKLICAYEIMRSRESGVDEVDAVKRIFEEYADLCALGTIADVMPVTDENRLIVSYGIEQIKKTKRKGLAALIAAANAPAPSAVQVPKKRKITSGFIGYGIAPRINAAGRISSATKAVELLLAETDEQAEAYAAELCEINRERQVEENRIADQAYAKIEKTFDPENDRVIVIDDDVWQQGIIGIVASRITERYGLPSILISFDGATRGFPGPDDVGKGSGRSIKGMNLVDAMNSCEDLLCKFGGHELAAGLTIERDKIPEFTRRINEYAKSVLTEDKLTIRLEADCELSLSDVTMPLAKEITKLEPFGVSNATPQFIIRDATVDRIVPISAGKHTKLTVSGDGVPAMTAMYFGMNRMKFDVMEGEKVDILCSVDINDFMNVQSVQLIVQDCRLSENSVAKCEEEKRRYAEIRAGGAFSESENVIPKREDFVKVYTTISIEWRNGRSTLSTRELLLMLGEKSGIGYIKLKNILLILYELKICGVEEVFDDTYKFDIYFNPTKTAIEKSSILKTLKGQCKN